MPLSTSMIRRRDCDRCPQSLHVKTLSTMETFRSTTLTVSKAARRMLNETKLIDADPLTGYPVGS